MLKLWNVKAPLQDTIRPVVCLHLGGILGNALMVDKYKYMIIYKNIYIHEKLIIGQKMANIYNV